MTEITIADPSALSIHPAAALFPLLDERELAELAGDIQTNGLASPIVVKDGQILDGRNRLRACELAGVPPHFVEWAGTGSVTSWIFSVNLHRRHLTASQRAMLAARAVEVFADEARERQQRGLSDDDSGRARHKAAGLLNVGATSVLLAQQVIARGAPELVAAVDAGDVPVKTATELVSLPRDEQSAIVREKKVVERAKEVRERRRPPAPPPPPVTSPPPPPPPMAAGADAPVHAPEHSQNAGSGDDGENEESTLDPANRPDPQPIHLTAFKPDHRRGTNPREEAAKVDQILCRRSHRAPRLALDRHRVERGQALGHVVCDHQSGQISMQINQAVAEPQEISAICNGRKPAPPPEGP